MNTGEIVRFKHPFKPTPDSPDYEFGIVVGIAQRESDEAQNGGLDEVIVYLYEPETSLTYVDETGVEVMYGFRLDEVMLFR